MDRRTARANAMKLIYEWEMGGDDTETTCIEMLEIDPNMDDKGIEFMRSIVKSVCESTEKIDDIIAAHLRGWTIERLSKVDLAILRIGTMELLAKETPAGIVINEAVELAKTYSDDRAPGFINGVLGAISRNKDL
jgi:transcription antitermination factor NusB